MNTHHNINYIEFQAKDLPSVQKFYEAVFGWSFTSYGPDYVAFTDGSLEGGFFKGTPSAEGNPLVIIYSSNLEASETAVIQHGGTIVKPIFPFPGGRRFHFTDPEGNQLAVWSD